MVRVNAVEMVLEMSSRLKLSKHFQCMQTTALSNHLMVHMYRVLLKSVKQTLLGLGVFSVG